MRLIGASLTDVEPGRCVIELPVREELTQQHGYVHGGVVAMIGADDDVLDWLRRDLRDGLDQPLRFGHAALSVGDQHALIGDDEHVGGSEFLVAGVEVWSVELAVPVAPGR